MNVQNSRTKRARRIPRQRRALALFGLSSEQCEAMRFAVECWLDRCRIGFENGAVDFCPRYQNDVLEEEQPRLLGLVTRLALFALPLLFVDSDGGGWRSVDHLVAAPQSVRRRSQFER